MIDNSSFEVDMTVSVELWPHDEGDLAVTVSVGGEHHHTMHCRRSIKASETIHRRRPKTGRTA
jgi:hypothetical protein